MNDTIPPISDRVLAKIQHGDITMRHRAYFIAGSILAAVASLMLGIASVYAFGILFLWVRIITADTMAYGARMKLDEAVGSFPWWSLIIILLSVPLIIIMVRRLGRMYRYRLSILLSGVLLAGIVLGFLLLMTGFMDKHETGMRPGGGYGPGYQQRLHEPQRKN